MVGYHYDRLIAEPARHALGKLLKGDEAVLVVAHMVEASRVGYPGGSGHGLRGEGDGYNTVG